MVGRGDPPDAEWERLEPFLPRGGARGGRWSQHRKVVNGVLLTGVTWRGLPKRFGLVCRRYRRWSRPSRSGSAPGPENRTQVLSRWGDGQSPAAPPDADRGGEVNATPTTGRPVRHRDQA
uniref:transposase n=1 Tax=Streptomyces fradiae TaxID=1906 RepID=UPI0040468BB8